jgi:hypothetical protein
MCVLERMRRQDQCRNPGTQNILTYHRKTVWTFSEVGKRPRFQKQEREMYPTKQAVFQIILHSDSTITLVHKSHLLLAYNFTTAYSSKLLLPC